MRVQTDTLKLSQGPVTHSLLETSPSHPRGAINIPQPGCTYATICLVPSHRGSVSASEVSAVEPSHPLPPARPHHLPLLEITKVAGSDPAELSYVFKRFCSRAAGLNGCPALPGVWAGGTGRTAGSPSGTAPACWDAVVTQGQSLDPRDGVAELVHREVLLL